MFTKEDISRYYDLSETHYRKVWNLDNSRSLHYGFWDDSTKDFHEALLNINKVLAAYAQITKNDGILDAGCGVGGSSIWLAKEIGCSVVGISLNKKQVDKANATAKELGLDNKLFFDRKDYSNTLFPADSFDVVWAIESVCYADDKGDFLKEASRILKPGGRLIIADFFKKDALNPKDATRVKQWANGWAINDFATSIDFKRKLAENNFKEIEFIDATHAIMPSAKKLYYSFFVGILGAKLYKILHPNATVLGTNNVVNAHRQYKTLRDGLWSYEIVKAINNHKA